MQVKSVASEQEVGFADEVWFVLKKIKKRMNYAGKDGIVEYRIISNPRASAEGSPIPMEEAEVLKVLAEWGAIEIVNPSREPDIAEVSLSQGMSMVIAIYSLKVLEPTFSSVYRQYKSRASEEIQHGVSSGVGSGKVKSLRWDSRRRVLSWGRQNEDFSSNWSVVLFLDVISKLKGKLLDAEQLKREYNSFCEVKYEECKEEGQLYCKRYQKAYTNMSASRTASNSLKIILQKFSMTDSPKNFPIQNQGSDKSAKVIWR